MISKLREPINALTHLVAASLAAVGLIILLYLGWDQPLKVITFLVYGISLIILFSASGLYHAIRANDSTTQILRKFDHSAIYLLIAGTYTPICSYFFEGFWQYGMIALIWFLAIIGIVIKIFIIKSPRWVSAGIYLIMGWLSILGVQEIIRTMPTAAILWLVMGGLMYTIGAIVYITKRFDFKPGFFGFHEVWHIFVILGAFCHYFVILRFIAIPS